MPTVRLVDRLAVLTPDATDDRILLAVDGYPNLGSPADPLRGALSRQAVSSTPRHFDDQIVEFWELLINVLRDNGVGPRRALTYADACKRAIRAQMED